MTDIFSEIEEDIRKDRAKRIWSRFGRYIIGGALLLVALVAAWRGWEIYTTSQARAAGDRFEDAVALLDSNEEAGLTALQEISNAGPDGYAALARFRSASALASADDFDGAMTSLRSIVDDASVNPLLQDVARIRLGYLLLDHGDASEIEGLLIELSDTTNPFSHSAREIRAFAAMRAGNKDQAQALFLELVGDFNSPEPIRSRARVALDVLASEGAGVSSG